ncbi:uncharacterized protein HD556DRAFT_1373682, partial [Suillus plorans]
MDTYASKHQRLLQSCGQEQPSIISIINVSGRDRGSKLYVAPKGNKDSCEQPQVNPSSYRTAMTYSKNAPPHPYVIPPRFQKQYAAPASHPQPPTESHLHIDQHKSQTLPTPTEPMSHHDTQPLGVKLGSHMQTLKTPSEPPKRPPGLHSPAGRGVALPVPSINVSLPPPSEAKKWARKERSSGPEFSVAELEAVTIEPETPEPSISSMSSSSVKLPSVRGRLRSSTPKPSMGDSTAPTPSKLVTDTKISSTSGKDEMCRKWFVGICPRGRWCHYAHTIIPTNLTCNLWLNGGCNRPQCPFAHKHQSSDDPVSNQLSAQNDDPQDVAQVADGPVKDQPPVRNGNVHKRIPSNRTCHRWLRGECSRSSCLFMHEHQSSDSSVRNQPPVQNSDPRDFE